MAHNTKTSVLLHKTLDWAKSAHRKKHFWLTASTINQIERKTWFRARAEKWHNQKYVARTIEVTLASIVFIKYKIVLHASPNPNATKYDTHVHSVHNLKSLQFLVQHRKKFAISSSTLPNAAIASKWTYIHVYGQRRSKNSFGTHNDRTTCSHDDVKRLWHRVPAEIHD